MKGNVLKKMAGVLLAVVLVAPIFAISAQAAPVVKPDGTVFDYTYYADRYPDLKEAFGYNEAALWQHYVSYGRSEGRICTEGGVPASVPAANAQFPYYIKVNRAANTVTVYGQDETGAYSIPVRAMVCSASANTILGTYTTSNKYTWRALYGGVFGQYATRISGPFLFHSVPYSRKGDPSSLEYWEYNKLGVYASLGCIRLSVADAKWIYDNCPSGTTVTLYDDADNPGPLGKPTAAWIDADSANRGWDPTDPDPRNPWLQ